MNSVHRQIGRIKGKGDGNNAKVSVLLNDFEDADKTLTKVIDASKAWRDAWVSILTFQMNTLTTYEELYNQIVGTSDGHRDDPSLTSRDLLERASTLKATYTDLKTELLGEVIMMDARVIRPVMDAKEYLQPLRKTIKKRENKRLDWERYIDKVNTAQRKMKRTDKENISLAKAEQDLGIAADAFKVADDHLREVLPPIISSAFSILPHVLAVQIMIQNTILAQYYTSLHNYCEDMHFPSPPPPMDDIIATFQHRFRPIQQETEGIPIIARGKAVHQSMSIGDHGLPCKTTTLNPRNALVNRRASSQNLQPEAESHNSRAMRIPSFSSQNSLAPTPSPEPGRLTPSSYGTSPNGSYFQQAAIAKKKPPPPPPKRIGSSSLALYAVALYPFDGQSQGDLSFSEGDRIKVVKKTDSTDDWWEGQLHGRKGSFPANYCKLS
ncbi:hypothetical protein BJ878DRAFT_533579 [Calycina marina]|uniref:SH3 domain-containing protein n=1 Tax=Calycina marina TaxID=1763456 RepID=A0A9P8CG61_9HELO|nr:hypothetical protein BJ878DRAFT_533579 [Calycina marina]